MHRGTALVATIMMLCATTAWAQKARAHIPFSFHVGDAELSAGDYEIVPGQPFHSSVMLRSRSNPANAAAALYFENEGKHPMNTVRLRIGRSSFSCRKDAPNGSAADF